MTIEQLWTIRCDWCGSLLYDAFKQRDHGLACAKNAGWQLAVEYNGFVQDLCPDCDHASKDLETLTHP